MLSQEVTSTGHALLEQFRGEQHQAVVGERVGEPEEHTHTRTYNCQNIKLTTHPLPQAGVLKIMINNVMITKEEEQPL